MMNNQYHRVELTFQGIVMTLTITTALCITAMYCCNLLAIGRIRAADIAADASITVAEIAKGRTGGLRGQ